MAITGPGLTATFTYDALGRRTTKTINGQTTIFVYDGDDIVGEVDPQAGPITYLRGLSIDEPLIRQTPGGNEYYHADALGSTLALTDGTGTPTTTYTYDPFGQTTVAGSSTNAFQFTSREHDSTGLYYYRARYYSPTLHRFISEDPIGLAGGDENFYAYTFNSPTNYTDPNGLFVAPGAPPPGCSGSTAGRKSLDDFFQGLDCASNFLPGGVGQVGKLGAKQVAQNIKNIVETAKDLAKKLGRNRVSGRTAGGKQVDMDLAGKGHFEKSTQQRINTPHVKESTINVGPNGQTNLSDSTVRSATPADIRTAQRLGGG